MTFLTLRALWGKLRSSYVVILTDSAFLGSPSPMVLAELPFGPRAVLPVTPQSPLFPFHPANSTHPSDLCWPRLPAQGGGRGSSRCLPGHPVPVTYSASLSLFNYRLPWAVWLTILSSELSRMPAHGKHSIVIDWMANEKINKDYHPSWVASRNKQRRQQKQEAESSGRK